MNISAAALASHHLEYRVKAFAEKRPHHAQVPNRPLGQNGFGLSDADIWNMTHSIMLQVQARLQADLMEVNLPGAYPPKKLLTGDITAYDKDVFDRIVAAIKAVPSYRIVAP